MKDAESRKTKAWIREELLHASARAQCGDLDPNFAAFLARLNSSDYRLAEAYIASAQTSKDPLQEVRTRIARGQLQEAQKILDDLANYVETSDEIIKSEIDLENCRIQYFSANWWKSIEYAQLALGYSDLAAVVRLTLYQIRALSWFELGEWDRALADLDQVQSISLLYPNAPSSFYGEILRIKILARKMGVSHSEKLLERLQNHRLKHPGSFNFDVLLTFCRTRLDLNRLKQLPTSELAFACFAIAELMGDDLYSALAVVDLAYGEDSFLRREAEIRLPFLSKRFDRVRYALLEVSSGSASASTRSITEYRYRTNIRSCSFELGAPPERLVLLNMGFYLDLATGKKTHFSLQARCRDILRALRSGPLPKGDLFTLIWGLRYASGKHDSLIHNTLLRTRRQSGIPIHMSDGVLDAPGSMIIS